jgi:hypothetical protein
MRERKLLNKHFMVNGKEGLGGETLTALVYG